MNNLREFVKVYRQNLRYYEKVSAYCANILDEQLQKNGIRSIVTFRAKSPGSVEKKVVQRSFEKDYETIEDIENDITDKAGVRVALYFPNDSLEVEKIIRSQFVLQQEPSRFDGNRLKYDKRFAGYRAVHFVVKLKDDFVWDDTPYNGEPIEIQVASLLMHAWAEVEHDLAYKEPAGGISEAEYALLAQLNGLVHSGEVTLEQLKTAINKRLENKHRPFMNHYELSSFILENISKDIKRKISEPTLGRADILFTLLERVGKNTPIEVKKYISLLEGSIEDKPICSQIVDLLVKEVGELDDIMFGNMSNSFSAFSEEFEKNYKANKHLISEFFLKWVEFEGVMRRLNFSNNLVSKIVSKIRKRDDKLSMQVKDIFKIQSYLMHGIMVPEEERLKEAIDTINEIVEAYRKHVTDVSRNLKGYI